ncbi:unnamed protein product [Citrullus colocynthis]|uniref:Uncharacterized protein n=1 Tax=Citrullus colocynthis TaxID=252529 RepID=A0ABP0Y5I6_9ROSI
MFSKHCFCFWNLMDALQTLEERGREREREGKKKKEKKKKKKKKEKKTVGSGSAKQTLAILPSTVGGFVVLRIERYFQGIDHCDFFPEI